MPPPVTAAYAYRRRKLRTPDAMPEPGLRQPPRSLAEVLGTGRLPVDFIKALSARFCLTVPNETPLLTNLRKGGGVHTFLVCLTAEAAPVPGLADLMLLGVEQDREAHILHSLFSVPVGLYDPDRSLFGCFRELPAEGLPAITKILVASFAARCVFSAVSQDDHRVDLEEPPPYGWKTTPCERASGKGKGQIISCQGINLLPQDAAAPLFPLEGSVGKFSKILFPLLADLEPHYEEALDWLQFSFTGDPKGQYMAHTNTDFYYTSPVEGEPLILPALKLLQTLYPGAYAWVTTSTSEGAELSDIDNINVKLSARTHPGAAGVNPSPGGGDPYPTQPSSIVKTCLDRTSAYRGQ